MVRSISFKFIVLILGSRFIQQKLERASTKEKQLVFTEGSENSLYKSAGKKLTKKLAF